MEKIINPVASSQYYQRLKTLQERTAELSAANANLKKEIAERQRAEQALHHRLTIEQMISEISTRFINLSWQQVDEGINYALQRMGKLVEVDRSYVFLFFDEGKKARNTHEWCAPGIAPQIQNLQEVPLTELTWIYPKILNLETIYVPCVAELPVEAETEKVLLQAQDIQSLLLVPLAFAGKPIGFLGFDAVKSEKVWMNEDVRLLAVIGEIITQSLQRRQAQEALEKAQALLAAENERKTGELEKARRLQLSMLPKEIPKLLHVEIDAYMKTATEVGGDYYDFQVGNDGALTVVIGDATEHGLNAGMIVTATKSILTTLSHESDPVKIFKHLNETLKRMNLSRHYMALQMIRIKDFLLEVCSAGMPPLLLYRTVQQQVEEISLKAMPLGSVYEFPYQKREVALSPGDVILLMSDGFPELFNPQGEIFDYERVQTAFAEVARQSPSRIIEHLVHVGEAWADGRPAEDDVTFVVLKQNDVDN